MPPPRLSFARVSTLAGLLLVSSCVHETEGRAPQPSAAASLPTLPATLPETAFRSDDEMRGAHDPAPAPAASRFETRRLGAEVAHPAPRLRGGARAPVDLDLKSADLANVFRLLADVGHVNIVIAGDVSGTITLRLKQVPWDHALELIARTRNLDLEQDGNVIVVTTNHKP